MDEDGRPRRKKRGVARDGEHFSFRMSMMDAARHNGARPVFMDGDGDAARTDDGTPRIVDAYGQPAGFRRGYAFVTNDSLRDASQEQSR